MNKKADHHWTYEENKICCEMYYKYYVVKKKHIEVDEIIKLLRKKLSHISEGSLKMKLQNIKSLLPNILDTCPLTPLEHYSNPNDVALKEIIQSIQTKRRYKVIITWVAFIIIICFLFFLGSKLD